MDAEQRRAAIAEKIKSAPQVRTGPRRFGGPRPFQAKPKPPPPPDFVPSKYTGRPSSYDPAFCITAVNTMAHGHSITGLAGELLVSKDAIYDWINAHPEFSHAIKIGRAARVRFLENKLLSTSMGVGVTAAIFALKNADPDEYRDIITNDHNIRLDIARLPDAKLWEIVGASAPALIEHKKDE